MPTISYFRGIRILINWNDHQPPHFHAEYSGKDCCILIEELELLAGEMDSKQLKMILGWAALHQDELREEWKLAQEKRELFAIEPLR